MESKKINFYVKGFESVNQKLNDISPSFCAAKWLQVSLHLTNGRTHSCYHPPTHQIDESALLTDPSALHNTQQKYQERKLMLEGQRPSGCDYCWKIEDAGHISDRYYRSSEHWAVNSIDQIKNLPYDHPINPTYVEVNFNQTCNFKCSYCSPHLSSEWQQEIEQFGPYLIDGQRHNELKTLTEHKLMPIISASKDNPYVQSFWQWWPDLYKTLKVFRMTGGEPLMDANTFKVLDYVYEHPNKQLELSVTSNMCPPKDLFDKFVAKVKKLDLTEHRVECYVPDPKNGSEWQQWPHYIIGESNKKCHNSELPSIERSDIPETFNSIGPSLENGSFTYLYKYNDTACKHFTLYISLDSVGNHAEYIRNGLNFDQLKNNVEKFLNETTNTSISFINTFNLLSIPRLKEFLEMILELRKTYSNKFQRIWFDIPILDRPEWLSVFNCTSDQILKLKYVSTWMQQNNTGEMYNKTRQGFKPYEVEKVQRNIDVIEKNLFTTEKQTVNARNFKQFFDEHDRRRNTNFIKTFPELEIWYREIK